MLKANILFTLTAKKLLELDYTVSKENGVDKEDLAGCNVFFTVAIGLCAAVAPACCRLLIPFKDLVKRTVSQEVRWVLLYINLKGQSYKIFCIRFFSLISSSWSH